jgi:hypothetical protein
MKITDYIIKKMLRQLITSLEKEDLDYDETQTWKPYIRIVNKPKDIDDIAMYHNNTLRGDIHYSTIINPETGIKTYIESNIWSNLGGAASTLQYELIFRSEKMQIRKMKKQRLLIKKSL